MPDDDTVSVTAKLSALMLVGTWSAVTLALTLGPEQTTIPPYWLFFTAIVFLIVGKLWDIEVSKVLPN